MAEFEKEHINLLQVPSGIQCEKSRKDRTSTGKLVSLIGAYISRSQRRGMEPGVMPHLLQMLQKLFMKSLR